MSVVQHCLGFLMQYKLFAMESDQKQILATFVAFSAMQFGFRA